MIKKILISWAIKLIFGAIVIGGGIWYLSFSIKGNSLSYTSVSGFLTQIGASDGDVSKVNGCFLCSYIQELFAVLGRATEMFWNAIVKHLWIVIAIGFGLFVLFHTVKYFYQQITSKEFKDLDKKAVVNLDFHKWFDDIKKTGFRILIVGVLMGTLGLGGNTALKTVSNIVITPVMYIGSELSMAATGVITAGTCELNMESQNSEDILNPVLKPFLCVIGNLNTVMLAGAGGGFALMNYAWLGLGGGLFTWLSGLIVVILFLVIGFNLFFQILSIVFKLIFLIIFLPLLLGAAAFEKVWGLAKGLVNNGISMLLQSAVDIIKISLKITITYATVYYAADTFFPPKQDNFSSIMPPLLTTTIENTDNQDLSVMNVFTTCEQISLDSDGTMNKDKFVQCFNSQKTMVERQYPGAFDFMDDGFQFLLFMIGIFFLYFWIVSPKIDKMLTPVSKESTFDYGQWVKDFGKQVYNTPIKLTSALSKLKK